MSEIRGRDHSALAAKTSWARVYRLHPNWALNDTDDHSILSTLANHYLHQPNRRQGFPTSIQNDDQAKHWKRSQYYSHIAAFADLNGSASPGCNGSFAGAGTGSWPIRPCLGCLWDNLNSIHSRILQLTQNRAYQTASITSAMTTEQTDPIVFFPHEERLKARSHADLVSWHWCYGSPDHAHLISLFLASSHIEELTSFPGSTCLTSCTTIGQARLQWLMAPQHARLWLRQCCLRADWHQRSISLLALSRSSVDIWTYCGWAIRGSIGTKTMPMDGVFDDGTTLPAKTGADSMDMDSWSMTAAEWHFWHGYMRSRTSHLITALFL